MVTESALERWVSPREAAKLLGLESGLGDELLPILEAEPRGLSASALATIVHRRGVTVREALAADRRFVRVGRGPGTPWRVRKAAGDAIGRGTERDRGLGARSEAEGRREAPRA